MASAPQSALPRLLATDSAVEFLLEKRRDSDPWQHNLGPILYGGTLVFSFFLCWLWSAYRLFLPIMAVVLALLLPFARAISDSGLLHDLLMGHSLDEVRQTRLTSAELADGITSSGLRWQLKTAIAPALIGRLMLASLHGRDWASIDIAAWIAWLVYATALASYALQFYLARNYSSHRRWAWPTTHQAGIYLLLISLTGLTSMALEHSHYFNLSGWAIGLGGSLLVLMEQRRLAIVCITLVDLSAPSQTVTTLQRRWTLKPWSDNPIVVRECARSASAYRWGFLSYVAQRGMILWVWLASILIPWISIGMTGSHFEDAILTSFSLLPFVMVAAVLIQCGAASHRVIGALSDETRKKTVEAILTSPLRSQDFVDGWAQVGYRSRVVELGLLTAVVVELSVAYLYVCTRGTEYFSPVWVFILLNVSGLLYFVICHALIQGATYMSLALGVRGATRCNKMATVGITLGSLVFFVAMLAITIKSWTGPAPSAFLGLAASLMAVLTWSPLGRRLSLRALGA